ncbi:low molecular weight phosphatase family protein [Phocicoccus pinnipedialis]|uniref:Low molecular weight protein-tyrosine-phosphatase PtpB n=1 Tax=Phocicoccus pinnipedialis TaxID=110845 RepID=A0A6V7R3Y2_9BACL|nr:low molecular weight phosphatase family protein [Jeotgalicoccus pinnipedialis]MBP1939945.1 protein-tyrosine phosphatase [Jeotgalicoccus pinnipedialis]CAD2072107.1 Low molecular weight protein-tyrosine-phosphatase PtpB [Jeotgalicoccus pinnipedialis]
MKEIIFVCTGNTCRSPLAESYANTHVDGHVFNSRGLSVTSGSTNIKSLQIIERESLKMPHLPRQLTDEDTENAVLITMTAGHKNQILMNYPNAIVYTLGELSGEHTDISDPYGGTEEDYEYTYQELRRFIDKVDFKSDIF